MARHTNETLVQLAEWANPRVQGWINYYGAIYGSALHSILRPLNDHLVRWARRKHKRLGRRRGQAYVFMKRIYRQRPMLFAHWRIGVMP
jgi:RNA-directed DNA polymerase